MTLSDAEMVKALRELASDGECEAPLSFREVADRLEQLTSAREHTITGCSEFCPHCGALTKHSRKVREASCPQCGELFKTTRSDRVYCSARCKKAAQMRRYRSRLELS